jgi:hypothetical protein
MIEVLLINNVIASERRQRVQEERRRNGRTEPYVNYLSAPQSHLTGEATLDSASTVRANDVTIINRLARYEIPT